MSTRSVKAGYLTISWDEKSVSAEDATIKIARVRTERKFTGAIEGTGTAEYIHSYHPDSKNPEGFLAGKPTWSYVGTCHFKGSIDGSPEGEVVFLTTNGSFVSVAEADWTVDEKSAIGGLKGLKGKGGYKHPIGASYSDPTPIWLEYTL